MESSASGKRCVYLDVLRIFAVFSMVLLHVSSLDWQTASVETAYWQTLSVYNAAVGYCVTLFVMLSGALWLSRGTIDVKRLYAHNILRVVTAFLFWSLLYALLHSFGRDLLFHVPFDGITLRDFFRHFIAGRYHLWFCFMIVGLYILLPLLKAMTERRELLNYFVAVGFVFAVLLPALASLPALAKLTVLTGKVHMVFFDEYVYFFVLGYWLYATVLPKPVVYAVCTLGLAAAVYLAVYPGSAALVTGERAAAVPLWALCDTLRLSAIFLLFKNTVGRITFSDRARSTLASLSGLCFGAYLAHDFFLWAINKVLPVSAFSPALSIPLLAVVETVLSFGAAWLVRRIPRIGKYIT